MSDIVNETSESMDSPIQEISMDLLNNKLYEYIYAKQYDAGRLIKIWITADNQDFDLEDCYVTFMLKKPDGTFIIQGLETTLEDGKFYAILNITNQMTIYPGKIPFQIVVSHTDFTIDDTPEANIHFDDSKSISTVTGYILVEESVVKEDDVASQIEISVIDQLNAAVANVGTVTASAIHSAELAAASADDSEDWSVWAKSYAIGGTTKDHDGTDDDVDNSKYYSEQSNDWSVWAKSYAVGGTDKTHDGVNDDEDNAKYYSEQAAESLSKITLYKIVTLYANLWENNRQKVEVIGVQADESTELIEVIPINADIEDYVEYGVLCIDQGKGELTFSCTATPSRDLQAYVLVRRIFEGEDGVHAIVIDDELSTTSTNAVQNKVVTNALNSKMDNTYEYKVILDQSSSQEDIAKYFKVRDLTGEEIIRASLIKNLNVLYMTIIVKICHDVGEYEAFFAFDPNVFEGTEEFGKIVPEYDFDAIGTFDKTARSITFMVEAASNAHNCFVNTYSAMSITGNHILRLSAQWVVNDND